MAVLTPASLSVEGLIRNLLPAQLWLLWARGHLSPASGHAAPMPITESSYGAISTGRARLVGPPHPSLGLRRGSYPSAQVLGVGYKLPAECRPPAPFWEELDGAAGVWEACLRREQKANPASLGGYLLQATSEESLCSLLNHLPRNYSWRAGRKEETSTSPPEITQPVRGPGCSAKATVCPVAS